MIEINANFKLYGSIETIPASHIFPAIDSRAEAGIRNLKHRMKLKTTTKKTISSLRHEIQQLKQEKTGLLRDISSMHRRRTDISKALQADEATIQQRLTSTLTKMKDEKPELFNITLEEQIGKLTGEIAVNFLKWIVS